MWNLAKGEDFLPKVDINELQKRYVGEQSVKPKLRLLCAIHRKRGQSIDEIAYQLSLPRRTVHGWLQKFSQRGVAAKNNIKQPGALPRLSVADRKRLVRYLERGPPHNPSGLWSTKEVRELIQKRFGVEYIPSHVWHILVSCGFSVQRPRKRHHKAAPPEEMRAFKKKRGAKPSTTERKDLLWARRTRPRSASSR